MFKGRAFQSMLKGWGWRCCQCGDRSLFAGYLKISEKCAHCGEAYGHIRADDAPPYFTIMIVGHLVVPMILWSEQLWSPALWIQMATWIPITMLLMLWFLPRIKGATLGLMWSMKMRGDEQH